MSAGEFREQLAGVLRRLAASDAGDAVAAIVAYGRRARQ